MSPARSWARMLASSLATFLAGVAVGAPAPQICSASAPSVARMPAAIDRYLAELGNRQFELRVACAAWAGATLPQRRAGTLTTPTPSPGRFMLFPADGVSLTKLARQVSANNLVQSAQLHASFVVVELHGHATGDEVRALLTASHTEFAEPDCDGPDFFTTSWAPAYGPIPNSQCWQRAARDVFPNDPCIDELWGHSLIGWDPQVAARSKARIVAVLDSGIDVAHAELWKRVVLHQDEHNRITSSQARELDEMCAFNARCDSHGTRMAGTIAGRMDNGVGLAGVAPNSYLLPVVITRIEHGHLARLSTIAQGIDAAARAGAEIINISAKWPVDSRAVSQAIRAATDGSEAQRRLLVTGYATALERDESVREYYPSRYRCLPGVVAAVPGDLRGHNLFNSPQGSASVTDGRIMAPGVDIIVATTDNAQRGYAMTEAAGASSAAAYVSGALALVWGTPPLTRCGAQDIKQLLFCRSKNSDSTRYPWVHVEFLRELSAIDPRADCRTALAALGCP